MIPRWSWHLGVLALAGSAMVARAQSGSDVTAATAQGGQSEQPPEDAGVPPLGMDGSATDAAGGEQSTGSPPSPQVPAAPAPPPAAAQAEPQKTEPTPRGRIEGLLGGHARLDGGPSGFEDHDPLDISLGLGAWYSMSETYLLGVVYQRDGLGRARTAPYGESASVAYDLNTFWLSGRLYTSEVVKLRPFIGLAVGGSWQEVHANGAHVVQGTLSPPEPFACMAVGPGLSLAGSGGVDVELAPRLVFVLEGALAGHFLSGGVVGDCARGAGSALGVSARLGFAYRFGAAVAPVAR